MRIPLPAKSIIRQLLANIQLSTRMNAIHHTCEYPVRGSATRAVAVKMHVYMYPCLATALASQDGFSALLCP